MQDHLDCVVSAIDSISYGDVVDVMVRRNQNWNLLPTQVDSALLYELYIGNTLSYHNVLYKCTFYFALLYLKCVG